MPRLLRLFAYVWLFFVLSRGCSGNAEKSATLSPEAVVKLKALSEATRDNAGKADVAKIGTEIIHALASVSDDPKSAHALLAIPFSPGGDRALAKLADSSFEVLFGKLAISHPNQVELGKEPLAELDIKTAVTRGLESHATYVICGGIDHSSGVAALSIFIVKASDSAIVWTKRYSPADDPAAVGAEVEAHIPTLEGN